MFRLPVEPGRPFGCLGMMPSIPGPAGANMTSWTLGRWRSILDDLGKSGGLILQSLQLGNLRGIFHTCFICCFFPREPQPFASFAVGIAWSYPPGIRCNSGVDSHVGLCILGQGRVMRTCGAMRLPAWPKKIATESQRVVVNWCKLEWVVGRYIYIYYMYIYII
jgi:hypothetical protein